MSYQVIARKWRPQTFDEVVFQDHVSRTLRNSITSGRISHAYLFSGPRGIGKTTMARILARALNCMEGPTPEPCGKCDNCLEIRNGSSFDVIEIDGASNNGVDDIRELRENVNFAPVRSRYKVYIIDEVHMVTTQAFNALLKTLEEPPPHVIFIFATTEIHRIPQTILSRCQKFFFKRIPIEPIVEHLKKIVDREGYGISEQALFPIARAAEGSMRDAQSLLDQVISFSDYRREGDDSIDIQISEQDALSILGVVPVESYIAQLACIIDMDPVASMNEVHRVVSMGIDIPRYVAGFMDILRSVRLIRNRVSAGDLLGLSRAEMDMLKESADKFHDEELGELFRIASILQNDLKYMANDRVVLEMALLDMIAVRRTPSVAEIIRKLEQGGGTQSGAAPGTGSTSDTGRGYSGREAGSASVPETAERKPAPTAGAEHHDITSLWKEFLASIRESRQYLYFILKPAHVEFSGGELCVRYPGGSDHSYYTRILDAKNISIIREEMSMRMGSDVRVTVGVTETCAETPGGILDAAMNTETGGTGNGTAGPEKGYGSIPLPDAEMLKNPEIEEYSKISPAVEKIRNTFHGEIINKGEK